MAPTLASPADGSPRLEVQPAKKDRTVIVVYQYHVSPFCDKVRRILTVKGLKYRVEEVAPSRSPLDVRRINRMGKLPVIADDGQLIADSTDIAHHIEARHPDPPLIPQDPHDRARCHLLEDWADESLYFYEMTMRFTWKHNAKRVVPVTVRHDARWFATIASVVVPRTLGARVRAQGIGRKPPEMVLRDLNRHVETLDALLDGREWLVGDTLTLADIAVAVQLSCIRDTDEGQPRIAGFPRVAAWLDRADDATR
jgi:glutathione S-transferase